MGLEDLGTLDLDFGLSENFFGTLGLDLGLLRIFLRDLGLRTFEQIGGFRGT